MKAPAILENLHLDHDENDLVVMQGFEKKKITINVRFLTTQGEDVLTKLLAAAPQMAAALQCPELDAAHDALVVALEKPCSNRDIRARWIFEAALAMSNALFDHKESRRQALLAAGFTEEVAS